MGYSHSFLRLILFCLFKIEKLVKKKEERRSFKNIKKPPGVNCAVNCCRGGDSLLYSDNTTTHDTMWPIRGHYYSNPRMPVRERVQSLWTYWASCQCVCDVSRFE